MFLQLLASELSKAPEIDTGLIQAERLVTDIPQIRSISDLEEVSSLRFQTFPFEEDRATISLSAFEHALIRAKHFQTAEQQLEEDFV